MDLIRTGTGILAIGMWAASTLAGPVFDKLSAEDQARLRKGEALLKTAKVDGKVWPKAWVYVVVPATAEEGLAVFSDYELQPTYIKNLESAKVVSRSDRRTSHVAYTIKVPVAGRDSYTVEDVVSKKGVDYVLNWKMLGESELSKSSVGYAHFESLGNESLLIYYNFVEPKGSAASLPIIRDEAMKQIKRVAEAIANQTRKEKQSNPALLNKQLEVLRSAIGK